MGGWLSIVVLMASAAGQKAPPTPKPRPTLAADIGLPGVDPLSVTSMTATPATITFSATDPDSPSDPGSSIATVTWRSNNNGRTWNLTVRTASTAFTNCSTVPISAVTVSCATATVGGGGTGACHAPFPLTTAAQVVANGNEAGAGTQTYTVTINFTLTDSWKYIAKLSPQCSISLTYTATAN